MPDMDKIKYVCQFACIILQIWLPCYYGEKIRTACKDLSETIYEINWYEHDAEFRKHVVLFLQRSQEDQCLMAGNQIPVSFQSFLAVIISNCCLN